MGLITDVIDDISPFIADDDDAAELAGILQDIHFLVSFKAVFIPCVLIKDERGIFFIVPKIPIWLNLITNTPILDCPMRFLILPQLQNILMKFFQSLTTQRYLFEVPIYPTLTRLDWCKDHSLCSMFVVYVSSFLNWWCIFMYIISLLSKFDPGL